MSLLEDVFLEDEAGEAQDLERVIEGDEYDERPVYPNSDDEEEKEDEAEEDKRRVDPTQGKEKRVIRNPRFILNPARLTGPRGIHVLTDHFKDFKFKGKGHEKEDLDLVLKKLEHWAYRLYPKFEFKDCLTKIETLGKKRPVMVHLHKIRSDQFISEETVVQRDSSDEEEAAPPEMDEFDKLLQQQIELARATPVASHRTPGFTPSSIDRSTMMPKATSSPSISEEQKERMLRNRRLAEERRLAKLKNDSIIGNQTIDTSKEINNVETIEIEGVKEIPVVRKHNRSNVIDSSDDDDNDEMVVNQSITVDVHDVVRNDVEMNNDQSSNETHNKVTDDIVEITNDKCIEITNFKETEVVNDINTDHKYDNDILVVEKTNIVNDKGTISTNNTEADIDNDKNNDKDSENSDLEKHNDVEDLNSKELLNKSNETKNATIKTNQDNVVISDEENIVSNDNENKDSDIEKLNNSTANDKDNLDNPADAVMDIDFSDDF